MSKTNRRKTTDLLEHLTAEKASGLMRELLRRHPDLRGEAASIAREILAEVSVEDIAADISERVRAVGLDELNSRAGSHSWGYVEPSEAACELLEEAVQDILEDMTRRKEAGLDPSAEKVCQGAILGLYGLRNSHNDGALGWAPDFPTEAAEQALAGLISMYPRFERAKAGTRIVAGLGERVGDWSEMLDRVVKEASGTIH